jgi:hypothetical protein
MRRPTCGLFFALCCRQQATLLEVASHETPQPGGRRARLGGGVREGVLFHALRGNEALHTLGWDGMGWMMPGPKPLPSARSPGRAKPPSLFQHAGEHVLLCFVWLCMVLYGFVRRVESVGRGYRAAGLVFLKAARACWQGLLVGDVGDAAILPTWGHGEPTARLRRGHGEALALLA